MLKKIAFSSLLLTCLLFIGCKSGYSPEVQKLHDEVMEIHDEVMPEMGTIHKLKKQLKAKLKNGVSVDVQDLNKNINALDYADDQMMEWMHQFKMPKSETEENLIKYLDDQKVKISKVDQEMRSAIKNAQMAIK